METREYLPEIECRAKQTDLFNSEIVTVRDDRENREHYLRVSEGFLNRVEGKTYLPVAVVLLDRKDRMALVQLPYETDAGFNRIWVAANHFRPADPTATI